MQSMTGYGSKEVSALFGTVSVELHSYNHKFLETVMHLPAGYLFLEDRLKKMVESKMGRGRVTCILSVAGCNRTEVHVDAGLLKKYAAIIRDVRAQLHLKDDVTLSTIMHLPGVLHLVEKKIPNSEMWKPVQGAMQGALQELMRMRHKEGAALHGLLRRKALVMKNSVGAIKKRFDKLMNDKLARLKSDEERVSFIKNTDITEEIERLAFHVKSFMSKLDKQGSVGKELDFIAQEMQREANTLAAKTSDVVISGKIIQVKTHIEQLREQVQNVE